MQDLVSRDWFKRMWTVQELIMANQPIAVCGNRSIRWHYLAWSIIEARDRPDCKSNKDFYDTLKSILSAEYFWLHLANKALWKESPVRKWVPDDSVAYQPWQKALDFLQDHGYALAKSQICLALIAILYRISCGLSHPLNYWVVAIAIWSAVITIIITPYDLAHKRREWEASLGESLPSVLHLIRIRQASVLVDKIFALHGVFEAIGITLEPPNYTKSIGEVCFEFTSRLIKRHGCFQILLEASAPGISGIPSWVPDWSKRHYRICRDKSATRDSAPDFSFLEERQDEASKDKIRSYICQRIRTKGVRIDRIASCKLTLQEEDAIQSRDINTTKDIPSVFLDNLRALMQWLSISWNLLSEAGQLYDDASDTYRMRHHIIGRPQTKDSRRLKATASEHEDCPGKRMECPWSC